VPRRYDFANLSEAEMHELIDAKIKKEENRYITRWPAEKISLENGHWGPLVKYGKKLIYIPKKEDGSRTTVEEAKALSLEAIKAIIETQVPGAFAKKKITAAPKKTKKASPKKRNNL
jgi:DNA topoisomerase-1